jgi:two-component system, NarL family, invasion response regulator UvrY
VHVVEGVERALAAEQQREQRVTVAKTAKPSSVTVLTVDDQAVFRRAARVLIAATPGFEEVAQAASGPEALELAAALMPDLVLLDVRMERMDGIETAQRLLAADPETVVVLLSMNEVPEITSAVASGVAAHLRKQDLSTRALRAVWDAHGRQRSRR